MRCSCDVLRISGPFERGPGNQLPTGIQVIIVFRPENGARRYCVDPHIRAEFLGQRPGDGRQTGF